MLYLGFWDSLLAQWSGRVKTNLSQSTYLMLMSLSEN